MTTNRNCGLSEEEFAEVTKNTPLVSIDLIVRNKQNEILLGLRKNDPARGYWFVPGGRICKDEELDHAFKRIAKNELKLDIERKDAELLGAYDHIYPENKFGEKDFSTHYVALGHKIPNAYSLKLSEDSQHSAYKWFKIEDLLKDKKVHNNTKKYFEPTFEIPNDSGIYRTLMSHYLHYDRQFWSRTQILLAIQGAALVGGYNLRDHWLGWAIMIGAFFLILIVWGLICRDIKNSRINQERMDQLAKVIFKQSGEGRLPVYLRSDPPFKKLKIFSGRWLIHTTITLILILNFSLAILYFDKKPIFPPDNGAILSEFKNDLKEISSDFYEEKDKTNQQLEQIRKELDSIKNDIPSKN
jgi:colanic acid biosynthesis protein WcaH